MRVPASALLLLVASVALSGCFQTGDGPDTVTGPDDGNDTGDGGNGNASNDDNGNGTTSFSNVTGFRLTRVVDGLDRPLYVTHAGDGSDRLFIAGKSGQIRVYDHGEVVEEPFADLGDRVSTESERGLLGLAFHPDYPDVNRVFLSYTDRDGTSILAEAKVDESDANRLATDSLRTLLEVPQPYANHNGGMITFGPDGHLYLSLGDGGSGGDPHNNGQDPTTLLGTILRLDVDANGTGDRAYGIPSDNPFADGQGGAPEVWVYGLRNPWRFSFDAGTGDLWIADVGQNEWEEVNHLPAGEQAGANLGWAVYEGNHTFKGGEPRGDVVEPVAEYANGEGRCSVSGGYVYRGAHIPPLQGVYLYGDFCSGEIWGVRQQADGTWKSEVLTDTDLQVVSFGTDRHGEVYVVDHGGTIHKVTPGDTPVPDTLQG